MKEAFLINIPEPIIADLKARLANTRWTNEIKDSGWDYGTNAAYLKELCSYWQTEFDWRENESQLNTFAHYKTNVDGFGLHFIYEKGKEIIPFQFY